MPACILATASSNSKETLDDDWAAAGLFHNWDSWTLSPPGMVFEVPTLGKTFTNSDFRRKIQFFAEFNGGLDVVQPRLNINFSSNFSSKTTYRMPA
uniref:Uncharacterized protein n=1 Tax=Romanomermis culicivorax TaxID=13658 RepID=A0A915ITM9_ROMCU